MYIKEVYNLLSKNGYKNKCKKSVHLGANLHNDYFIKDGICISFFKIDNKLSVISIWNEWNTEKNCGKCLYYDISIQDIISYINGIYKPFVYVKNTELEDSLPF
jgi:hypothetical protein